MQLKLYVNVSAFFFFFILFGLNLLVPSFYDTGIPVSGIQFSPGIDINSFIPVIPNNRAPIHIKNQGWGFFSYHMSLLWHFIAAGLL